MLFFCVCVSVGLGICEVNEWMKSTSYTQKKQQHSVNQHEHVFYIERFAFMNACIVKRKRTALLCCARRFRWFLLVLVFAFAFEVALFWACCLSSKICTHSCVHLCQRERGYVAANHSHPQINGLREKYNAGNKIKYPCTKTHTPKIKCKHFCQNDEREWTKEDSQWPK